MIGLDLSPGQEQCGVIGLRAVLKESLVLPFAEGFEHVRGRDLGTPALGYERLALIQDDHFDYGDLDPVAHAGVKVDLGHLCR